MNRTCPACRKTFPSFGAYGNHIRYSASCTHQARFWACVDKSGGAEACWPWLASKYRRKGKQMGYGRFQGSGPYTYAHRCAWIFTHGEIPSGLLVMHKCDNVICCNPAHLRTGTDKDNSDDKIAKGRAYFQIMRTQQ